MAAGQCTRDTLTYTFTDAQLSEPLYISDVTLLQASMQLSTSLTLWLGLQRGPVGGPHFPEIHVVH